MVDPWPGRSQVTLRELQPVGGYSRRELYAMIERGELRAERTGQRYRVRKTEALRVCRIEDTGSEPPQPPPARPMSAAPAPELDRKTLQMLRRAQRSHAQKRRH